MIKAKNNKVITMAINTMAIAGISTPSSSAISYSSSAAAITAATPAQIPSK